MLQREYHILGSYDMKEELSKSSILLNKALLSSSRLQVFLAFYLIFPA